MRYVPSREELSAALNEVDNQSDRGAAIILGALVELALEATLEQGWPEISNTMRARVFEGTGPLATFSAKIEVGHASGVFGPTTRANLHLIRKIRNEFAHRWEPLGFEADRVRRLCSNLKLLRDDWFEADNAKTVLRNQYERVAKTTIVMFSTRGYAPHPPAIYGSLA